LPSPTSGSPAKSSKVIQAPPWLIRFFTPWIARYLARELAKKHPDLGPEGIVAMMRADLHNPPTEEEQRLLDAVRARLPEKGQPVETDPEKPVSAWVLLAANLVPLAGVLFWNWNVFALIVLFWMENVIVGVFFVLRMLLADPRDPALWAGKLLMIPFFCFHYGLFTVVHGTFVFSIFGGNGYPVRNLELLEPAMRAANDYALWLPVGVLVASHLFSFLWNYLYRGEFRRAQLARLMATPYGRVVVLHVGIILGGIATMALGSPLWALLVLLGMKIGLDLKAHLKEHSQPKA
jgi:hypothetical protein